MPRRTSYDGLLRFRKTTEDAAQRVLAERQKDVDKARHIVRALDARLNEETSDMSSDAAMLASQHAAHARLRKDLTRAHQALSAAQAAHGVAHKKLAASSAERRAAERLVERALREGNLEQRRRERRDEDEVAMLSREGARISREGGPEE